jgi:exodeoxyribonuclease III
MPPKKRKAEIDERQKPAKKMKVSEVKEEEIKLSGDGKFNKPQIKIVSWNLNGIRAVMKRDNFLSYAGTDEFDVICFNETKLQDANLPEIRAKFPMYGYHYWTCSKAKKGYSGVALLSKVQPISVAYGIGITKHDAEGRVVTAEFDTFYVVSTYIPNAGQVRFK